MRTIDRENFPQRLQRLRERRRISLRVLSELGGESVGVGDRVRALQEAGGGLKNE